jgi:hypothetical protein
MSESFQHARYVEELNPSLPLQDRTIIGSKPGDDRGPKQPYISRFGGLDLAKRVDHSALMVLRLDYHRQTGENFLYQEAHMTWPHVNYKKVAKDTFTIYRKYPWEFLGFDRQGVGDAASELFDVQTLRMEPISTTMEMKKDIIKIVKGLFEAKKLVVDPTTDIKRQILEQETIISNAGNELYKHPQNTHDDLFWALGYACYVAMPYVIGYPAPLIRRVGVVSHERDIDKEIDMMMGGNTDAIFSI